jgi:hypothetical protein
MMRHPWNAATEEERKMIGSNLRAMVQSEGWKFMQEFFRFRIDYIKERVFDADVDSEVGRREIAEKRQERKVWEVMLKRPEEWIKSADGLFESQSEGETDG